jgi:hypothetical protein
MVLAHRAERSQSQLAGVAGRGLGDDVEAPTRALVDDSQIDADIATDAAMTAAIAAAVADVPDASKLKFVTFTGVDADPTPAAATVTGIEVGDTLLAVLDGGAVAQDVADYEITDADEVTVSDGADNDSFQYVAIFIDADA